MNPKVLKGTREHLGLSQFELAAIAGVDRSFIADYESGRTKWKESAKYQDILDALHRVEQIAMRVA